MIVERNKIQIMKKFLMAAIALFMMAGTVGATENCVAVENCVATVVTDNVADKLLSIIKSYTKKIEAATSKEALERVYANFEAEMAEFAEKNATEVAAFDENLTKEQEDKYKAELTKVMKEFEKALEKKAMLFIGE